LLKSVDTLGVGTRPKDCPSGTCGNPVLTDFDLGSLRQGMISIYSNPLLPQCKVDALAKQVQQAGLGGAVMSGDNGSTCPP
jgi:hypothetical protein